MEAEITQSSEDTAGEMQHNESGTSGKGLGHTEVKMGLIVGMAIFLLGLTAESLIISHADRFAFEEAVRARLARYGVDRREGNR